MSKKYILNMLKCIGMSYVQCFITLNVIISITAAILSDNLLVLLFTTFKIWVYAEILLLLIGFTYKFIKKLIK